MSLYPLVNARVVELVDKVAGEVLITRDGELREVLEPFPSKAYERFGEAPTLFDVVVPRLPHGVIVGTGMINKVS